MSDPEKRYAILNDGRRLPTGGPLLSEYYGPTWNISVAGGPDLADSAVIVPDPGDGSALPLAERIVDFLNSMGRESSTAPRSEG
jgi:hypothetical protein